MKCRFFLTYVMYVGIQKYIIAIIIIIINVPLKSESLIKVAPLFLLSHAERSASLFSENNDLTPPISPHSVIELEKSVM